MPRKIMVSPSLLAADFGRLREEVQALDAAGTDWLHWDCMDGHFTVPLTFGPMALKAVRDCTRVHFDAHLMLTNPEAQIPQFVEAGADGITIHLETTDEPDRLLQLIRDFGCLAGLTINPPTPVAAVQPLLPLCDLVMLMGVMPGYYGQPYQPQTTARIAELRRMIDAAGLPTLIEVDGGVAESTIQEIVNAGAEVLVSGAFVLKSPTGYADPIARLHALGQALP